MLALVHLDLGPPLAFSCFIFSAFLKPVTPSSSFGTLRICRIRDSFYLNVCNPFIDLSSAPSTFLCLSGVCSTFLDLQICSICLICSPTLRCQLLMTPLMSETCEIGFQEAMGKLALDLRRQSGHEV
jgi:hypothetical protein